MQDFSKWSLLLKKMYGMNTVVVADKREMSRDEWLQERKNGVGGSEIGKILGSSKYGTALDVFYDKIGREDISVPFTEAQQEILDSGSDMEGLILDLYRKKTGRKVVVVNAILSHPYYHMTRVNVDAIVQREDGKWGVLEVKNTMARGDEWKNGQVPVSYQDQCRYGMWICGLSFGEVVNLRSGRWTTESIFQVEESIEWIHRVQTELTKFWMDVCLGIQPEYSEKDDGELWRETLGRAVALSQESPVEIVADDGLTDKINGYHHIVDEIKNLTDQAEQLKAYFASELSAGGGSIVSESGTVVWKKSAGASKFDRKAFEKENPQMVDRYVSKGEPSMRMTFKW